VLSSARVGGATLILTARVILRTVVDTSSVLFSAEEVGDRFCVFGGVWRLTIAADTAILEGVLFSERGTVRTERPIFAARN
jgi:hypothetical protein